MNYRSLKAFWLWEAVNDLSRVGAMNIDRRYVSRAAEAIWWIGHKTWSPAKRAQRIQWAVRAACNLAIEQCVQEALRYRPEKNQDLAERLRNLKQR